MPGIGYDVDRDGGVVAVQTEGVFGSQGKPPPTERDRQIPPIGREHRIQRGSYQDRIRAETPIEEIERRIL